MNRLSADQESPKAGSYLTVCVIEADSNTNRVIDIPVNKKLFEFTDEAPQFCVRILHFFAIFALALSIRLGMLYSRAKLIASSNPSDRWVEWSEEFFMAVISLFVLELLAFLWLEYRTIVLDRETNTIWLKTVGCFCCKSRKPICDFKDYRSVHYQDGRVEIKSKGEKKPTIVVETRFDYAFCLDLGAACGDCYLKQKYLDRVPIDYDDVRIVRHQAGVERTPVTPLGKQGIYDRRMEAYHERQAARRRRFGCAFDVCGLVEKSRMKLKDQIEQTMAWIIETKKQERRAKKQMS